MRSAMLVIAALVLVCCNRDPQYTKQAYLNRGNYFFKAGKTREAVYYYGKAIEQDRRFGEAWYRLALTDLKKNSPMAALRPLYVAVELLPRGTAESNEAILKLSGILVEAARQTDQNDALIREIAGYADGLLKANADSWQGRQLRADLALLEIPKLIRAQKVQDAKRALAAAISGYRVALAANPGDYSVTIALSRALIFDGQLTEGENLLAALVQKEKQNSIAYIELYQLYDAERRLPQCEAVLKKAIQNIPDDPSLRIELARFYRKSNRPEDLLKMLSQMKTDLGHFPVAYIQAGEVYLGAKQFPQAIEQYEAGISKDPGKKIVYLKYEVQAYVQSGRLTMAVAKNDQILKIDRKDPEGRCFKAALDLDTGKFNTALTELQSVVIARPLNPVAHFHLGRAYLGEGKIEQARQEFDKAVQLRPSYARALVALILISLLRGDTDWADRQADGLLRIAPGSVEAVVTKAAILEWTGKYQRVPELDAHRARLLSEYTGDLKEALSGKPQP